MDVALEFINAGEANHGFKPKIKGSATIGQIANLISDSELTALYTAKKEIACLLSYIAPLQLKPILEALAAKDFDFLEGLDKKTLFSERLKFVRRVQLLVDILEPERLKHIRATAADVIAEIQGVSE